MKWGVVCSAHTKRAVALAEDVVTFLSEYGDVLPERTIAEHLSIKGHSFSKLNEECDIVITIGGDGTIIRALSEVEKPLFTINSGGMGFLSEVESKFALQGLKKVIDGEYNVEERAKLHVDVEGVDKALPDVANEVTLQTARIAKIMYFHIFVEDELLETMGADGVIVATPTGSTSYALSVGGPIMDPTVEAMIIAPMAPFRLSARPWVVPLKKKVQLQVLPKSRETKLVIDGNFAIEVTVDQKITVRESKKKARFIRFGESFYQMVRLKLVR
jgi:NAD+ kinase